MSVHNYNKTTMNYEGCELFTPEVQFLYTLELIIGEKIPSLNREDFEKVGFGFIVKNKHIVCLGLRNKNILTLPKSIAYLRNLEILDLTGNPLRDIPEIIRDIKNLKVINLNNNQIQILEHKPENDNFREDIKTSTKSKKEISKNSKLSKIIWIFDSSNDNHKNEKTIALRTKLNEIIEKRKKEHESQDSIYSCEKCKSQNFKSKKINLEIVRKSPRKLVFIINSIDIECDSCFEIKELNDPKPSFLNLLSNFLECLKSELKYHLKQHYYCAKCNDYHKNLERCPKHDNRLIIPRLVFIRGINQQYASSGLLGKNNYIY
ncbi:MAG: leucine-rich repeat domain-containing protein [Candidatus Lokiarchaeia archaeon]